MHYTRTINGHTVPFDDRGSRTAKHTIVCFPGLGMDHRGFKYILPYLLSKYRVVRLLWRGHGIDRDPAPGWTEEDQASDTIALLDSLEVGEFIPLTHSHGAWAAMEVAARLRKKRVPAIVLTDLIMNEAPADFMHMMKLVQDKATWSQARQQLYEGWSSNTKNENIIHFGLNYGGGHDFPNWAHFCWLVESMYRKWGSPFQRLEAITEPPIVRHVFSHSKTDDYRNLHEEYEKKHPEWFSFVRLDGDTHFPVVELPESTAKQIDAVIKSLK